MDLWLRTEDTLQQFSTRKISNCVSKALTMVMKQLFCDSMAAVTRTNYTIAPGIKTHIAAEYDISQEICPVKEEGIDLQTHWVLLPLDTQLNIQVDADVITFCHSPPPDLAPSSNP
eukprot:2401812-Ditylum_brightwellii.AAC.1